MAHSIDIFIDTGNAKDISVELKGSGSQNIPTELEKVVDYEKTKNKPRINGVELIGDKTTEDLGIELPDISHLATKEELDGKQDVIPDLSTIRTGAGLGATAVQPSALNNYATKSYVDYSLINGTPTVTGGNSEISLQDRAITTVTVDDTVSLLTFIFPQKTDGKARDFFVRLVVIGDSIPTLSFIEPNGDSVPFDVDDDSWAEIEQGVNILMFTDTGE